MLTRTAGCCLLNNKVRREYPIVNEYHTKINTVWMYLLLIGMCLTMLVVMICRVSLKMLYLIPILILFLDWNIKLYLYSSKRDLQKNVAPSSICLNINLVKLPFQQIIVDILQHELLAHRSPT